MGWICSQFRVAGYVFAEVKQRKRSKRYYFVTKSGQSDQDYDELWQAFEAAEEAVIDMMQCEGWGLDIHGMTIDYVAPRKRS